MPALGTIAIADGTTPTPVVHTFVGRSTTGSDAVLKNTASSSIPQGFETMEIKVRDPSRTSTTAAYVVSGSLVFPTTVTDVNGVTTVDRTSKFEFTLYESQKSTLQDRKNHRALIKNLFADATIGQVIENLEPLY